MARPRAVVDAAQSEADYQAQIVALARAQGWRVYFTWNSKHSPAGWPDLVLLRGQYMICLEVKAEKGAVSDNQKVCLAALRQVRHVEVAVVRPEHWDQVAETLMKALR